MSTTELLLIDLSSLAHPLYHMSASEPDPNWTSTQIVARVRALSSQHPHAAICCDTGKSFRNDLAPRVALGDGKFAGYKADRPERDARLYHQINLALERLRTDGYPVWSAQNFEADDVIATATVKAIQMDPEVTVLIASADKDLLQLVSPRVRWKSVAPQADGVIRDEAAIVAKFGITATQLHDWLCLVGDSSDNVVGAKGIGAVKATELLKKHGSIDAIYAAMDKGVVPGITPGLRSSLVEFRDRWPLVSSLITLRADVEGFEFSEIASERTAPPMEDAVTELKDMDDAEFAQVEGLDAQPLSGAEAVSALGAATEKARERIDRTQATTTMPTLGAVPGPVVASQPAPVSTAPVEFSQQLEPRNMSEAKALAKYAYDSRMFSGYGTEQAVLMVLMAGRELGMTAMASLRGFHVVEGKATLSADLIRALIIRSGKANYFRPTERTPTRATWETQRGDDPPVSLTFTIEEAQQAGVVKNGSGWVKYPADMLTARASAKLARLVYSDIVFNLYDPSEIG